MIFKCKIIEKLNAILRIVINNDINNIINNMPKKTKQVRKNNAKKNISKPIKKISESENDENSENLEEEEITEEDIMNILKYKYETFSRIENVEGELKDMITEFAMKHLLLSNRTDDMKIELQKVLDEANDDEVEKKEKITSALNKLNHINNNKQICVFNPKLMNKIEAVKVINEGEKQAFITNEINKLVDKEIKTNNYNIIDFPDVRMIT